METSPIFAALCHRHLKQEKLNNHGQIQSRRIIRRRTRSIA